MKKMKPIFAERKIKKVTGFYKQPIYNNEGKIIGYENLITTEDMKP